MDALKGIRVVEFTQNLAGPYAGEILGWMGADVIKVERPQTGDDCRAWGPPFINGSSVVFNAMNRGKRSVALDLKDPEGLAAARALIADADILIENMRPGSMEEVGLGHAPLLAEHPRLIYGSISAFGNRGPMATKAGYEEVVQGFAGIFSINGDELGRPSRIGSSILDMSTGVWLALGCLGAVIRRSSTGQGGLVEAALVETALMIVMQHIGNFTSTGKTPARSRSGTPRVVVCNAFPTRDGEIVIVAANDRLMVKLAIALGHPEWARDERFRTSVARVAHRDALYELIGQELIRDTTAAWVDVLDAHGVPCGPVNDIPGMLASEQIEALDILETVDNSALRLTGLPLRFDGARPRSRGWAPTLGEHSAEPDRGSTTNPSTQGSK